MKDRKGTLNQVGNAGFQIHAHSQQPLLPALSVPASDSKYIGFGNIAVGLHEVFQFWAAQRKKQHPLLEIRWNLGIWNHDFRQYGMCPAAFFAFDTENAQDNGALSCFQPSAVISVTNQTARMAAAAAHSIQWKIRCDIAVNFLCYPLEAFENSCYHINALMSNDFCHCWLCASRSRLCEGGFLLFCYLPVCGFSNKPVVMIPWYLPVRKGWIYAPVYTVAYQAVRENSCS